MDIVTETFIRYVMSPNKFIDMHVNVVEPTGVVSLALELFA
jgi:hypothetical protein